MALSCLARPSPGTMLILAFSLPATQASRILTAHSNSWFQATCLFWEGGEGLKGGIVVSVLPYCKPSTTLMSNYIENLVVVL